MDGGISCPGKEGVISIQGGASRVGGAPCSTLGMSIV